MSGVLLLVTSFKAIRLDIPSARQIMYAMLVTFGTALILSARTMGLIPSNEVATFIVTTASMMQAILLSAALSELMEKIRSEKEQAIRLYQYAEIQALSKESAFLLAQIKPHFLYNTLNTIEALCYIDAHKAGDLVLNLSEFLHHSFDFQNQEAFTPFEEELKLIKAYVKIEQTRFPNTISVLYDLEDTDELRLPPLLLQPLIENAIKHGIRKQGVGGTVTLRVRNLPENYRIEVEDDGIGMTEEQIRSVLPGARVSKGGVGLANIQKRLNMLYATELVLESTPGRGTKATILLQKEKGESHESGAGGRRVLCHGRAEKEAGRHRSS